MPEYTSDIVGLYVEALGATGTWGACTGYKLDEFYVFEKIEANRLIVLDHNWDGAKGSMIQERAVLASITSTCLLAGLRMAMNRLSRQ